MEIKETEVYTTIEAANFLKISEATMRRRIRDGSIHSLKMGRIRRIRGKDLLNYMEEAVDTGGINSGK
jgi:excisionase family DNA binding protein